MNTKAHWDAAYRRAAPEQVSWYQPELTRSLDLILHAVPDHSAAIIDVGGGASTLMDSLLSSGYHRLTVLDFSGVALAAARHRLGPAAASVRWLETDVLEAGFGAGEFDLWHDRAVFHFLTDPSDRRRYVTQLARAVRPGGYVVLATFAADGPPRCSGLEVARYSPEALQRELGERFTLQRSHREEHRTPDGRSQPFTYGLFRVVTG